MNKCKECKRQFEVKPNTKGSFCGYKCYWNSLKDKQPKNMDGLKLGHGWNKGIFKEKAHYNSIHRWIQNNFATTYCCDLCKSTNKKNYEWANISGQYRRDKDDWMRLCVSCHRHYDLKYKKEVNYFGYY